jgi:beta-glucanase (GH16 family)
MKSRSLVDRCDVRRIGFTRPLALFVAAAAIGCSGGSGASQPPTLRFDAARFGGGPPAGTLPPVGGNPAAEAGAPPAPDVGAPGPDIPGWNLVWRDEFDGPAGGAPDETKWNLVVGPNRANAELEYYTARRENSALDGAGNLVITALSEAYMGRLYTSTRMNTNGKFTATYGRFEVRAKLPVGKGLWPAFWLLGANMGQVGWPMCGEIDILENNGTQIAVNHGSLHGPGYSGGSPLTGTYRLPPPAAFNTGFHVFAVEWEQNVVRFYVDNILYQTRTPNDAVGKGPWVYDHPFYLILNVAVGGTFTGTPDATTTFPQTLVVDYVRVYSRS